MKTTGVFLSVVAMLVLTAFMVENIWKADVVHSQVGFTITHMGISDVSGTFNDFEATIKSDEEDFSDALVEAVINVASIDTRVEQRDEHLRSADFFDVEKYPQITFKSTGIYNNGEDKYKLTGNLTVKGITKPVMMDLTYRGTIEHPMSKKPTTGFNLSGTIKRSDFGIGSGFPPPMLSDEVYINISAELQQ